MQERRFLSKRDFKELFRYEENDRDKKILKKDAGLELFKIEDLACF